jgi:hypothetical protein
MHQYFCFFLFFLYEWRCAHMPSWYWGPLNHHTFEDFLKNMQKEVQENPNFFPEGKLHVDLYKNKRKNGSYTYFFVLYFFHINDNLIRDKFNKLTPKPSP